MLAPDQLIELIDIRRLEYLKILKNSSVERLISRKEFDINLFVPVRKRTEFFKPFIRYARIAEERSSCKVRFIFVEEDTSPQYLEMCRNEEVDYLFIPSSETNSNGLFAKSLAYNIGFIDTPKTKWNIFHDLDILVDKDYFLSINSYLEKGVNWLQPYSDKRVVLLGTNITKDIVESSDNSAVIELQSVSDKKYSSIGCPGGSIVVKLEDFLNVGGYDPELFFGYGPEDSFFWSKLEVIHGATACPFSTHFQGKGSYASDPRIEVYHLNHTATSNTNPLYGKMLDVLESFYRYSTQDKRKIVDFKKQLLREAVR
jgi:hypothetical protein